MSKARVYGIGVAGLLALLQIPLMPLLTCKERGSRPLATDGDTFPICLAIFIAVLGASLRSDSARGSEALWHCGVRAILWSAVTSLFFFEIWCIGLLRFEEIPTNMALHGDAVILFFAIMWAVSFQILRIGLRRPPAAG